MRFLADISLAWIIPMIALAGLLTWVFYRKEPWMQEIPRWAKRSLYALRFTALLLIGILLLGILFESVSYRNEKPVFITLVDNSQSLRNYKDSAVVQKQINTFQAALKEKFGEQFDLVSYTTGSGFKQTADFSLGDNKSNLSEGFEQIYTKYYNRNIGGIVFISDGNFNEGPNPVYAAEKIALTPIFGLGVGDTMPKRDQLIRDISSNEIAFLKNKFTVEVDLEALKIGKRSSSVSLIHNGKTVANTSVNYEDGDFDFKHVSFEPEATEIGFQQYTVEVKPVDGEYTLKNNRRSFYIEVLDGRNKVILLAGAPHPDVAALKYVLEKDENVQVESKLIGDWDKDLSKTDLVIWHEPGINYNTGVQDVIARSGKPVLYFIGPNTNNATAQKLDVGISFGNSAQTDEVQPGFNKGFELFEISTALQDALRFYPPVVVRYGEVRLGNQNKVLLSQRLGEVVKKDPILFFGEKNNRKYGVFFGEGIWRWKLHEFSKSKSTALFEELIQKVSQYLVVKQNASSLRITLPRRFMKGEEVKIKAEFYNESLELITKPVIEFILTDETGKKSNFEFGVTGNFYALPLGTLKPGKYNWIARTSYAGKKHEKKGLFVVEDVDLEALDTRANHSTMLQMATNSNAKFFQLKNHADLLKAIEQRDDIAEMAYEESAYNDLLDYVWILLLIIALLGAEWFLRRWNGAY
jgi:hypothetical protein